MNTKAHLQGSFGGTLFFSALAAAKPTESNAAVGTWQAHVLPHGAIEELALNSVVIVSGK